MTKLQRTVEEIKKGKYTLKQVNEMLNEFEACDWTVLRGAFNDYRLERIEKHLHKLESNHIVHLMEDVRDLRNKLKSLKKLIL